MLLRQVRISLKVEATNKEIDECFARFDADKNGSIDTNELKAVLQAFHDAAMGAKREEEHLHEAAALCRERAVGWRAAAATMGEVETLEAQLNAHRASQPLDARLAAVLVKRTIKTVDAVSRWKGAENEGCVGRAAWRAGVLDYLASSEPNLTANEIDRFFEASVARGGGGTLQLKAVLKQGHEKALKTREEEESLNKNAAKLCKAAGTEQSRLKELVKADELAEARRQEEESSAEQSQRRAEEAASAAKAAAKAEKKKKDEQEKKDFNAKVEQRRKGSVASTKGALPTEATMPQAAAAGSGAEASRESGAEHHPIFNPLGGRTSKGEEKLSEKRQGSEKKVKL